jgi:hypothetical protein
MKKIFASILILFSRVIDLFTTQLGVVNFKNEEQNFLVKLFNLNYLEFCIIELLLAFLLILIYLYSSKNHNIFKIKTNSFYSFLKILLYKKNKLFYSEYLINMSLKRVLVLFGSIIPSFIFITSSIFSINNVWVYLYIKGNKKAMLAYDFLESYHFFDFIIFILPVLILAFLLYRKLKKEY